MSLIPHDTNPVRGTSAEPSEETKTSTLSAADAPAAAAAAQDSHASVEELKLWADRLLVDVNEIMLNNVKILESGDSSTEQICEALDNLQDLVEEIDRADNLHKMKGLEPVLKLLRSADSGVRQRAAFVLSTALQNNVTVQGHMMELNGLPVVMEAVKNETEGPVLFKLVAALAALVKNRGAAQLAFASADGIALLIPLLEHSDNSVVGRVLFLLSNLAAEHAAFAASALRHNCWPHLMRLCRASDADVQERALDTIHVFVTCSAKIAEKAAAGGLANVMQEILEKAAQREELADVRERAGAVLNALPH